MDGEHLVPVCERQLVDGSKRHVSRRVEHAVDPPEIAQRAVDGLLDSGFVGDVAGDPDRPLELACHLRRTLLRQVHDRDPTAFGGVRPCHGRADPRSAAGREQHLCSETVS